MRLNVCACAAIWLIAGDGLGPLPAFGMAKRDMADAADEVYKGKPNPAG